MRIPRIITLTVLIISLQLFLSCKTETVIGRWPDGIVPYYFSGDFTDDEVQLVRKAMDLWETHANISFEEVTPRSGVYNLIRVHANAWTSSIGENNSTCYMLFGDGSDPFPHVVHELGHALGLVHEHQRPDRDDYINIFFDRIIPQFKRNFEIRGNPLITESLYPYDYQSVMHYPTYAFSEDGRETIAVKDDSFEISRQVISEIDSLKIKEIYGPPDDSN